MTLDFYYMAGSAPCRSVIMVAKELNIPLNMKPLDLMKGEQMTPEFLKINPQHCIPTLHDTESGFALWESRAILTYLVNRFSPGHALYPTNLEQRATVERLLYFDLGSLYPAIGGVVYPQVFKRGELTDASWATLKEKLTTLDQFLSGRSNLVGDSLTLADLAVYTSLTMLDIISFSLADYPNIVNWHQQFAKLSYDAEVNQEPVAQFKAFFESQKSA